MVNLDKFKGILAFSPCFQEKSTELPWAAMGPSLVCHIGTRNPWATTDVVSRLQDPRAPETDHDGPRTRRHLMSINVCYGIQWEFHVGLMEI